MQPGQSAIIWQPVHVTKMSAGLLHREIFRSIQSAPNKLGRLLIAQETTFQTFIQNQPIK